MAPPKTKDAPRGTIHGSLFNGLVTYTIRALSLPEPVIEFLSAHTATIANLLTQKQEGEAGADVDELDASDAQGQARMLAPEQFWQELEALFKKAGPEWAGAADRIWTFGPKRVGANMLLDPEGKSKLRSVGCFSESNCDSQSG
jgi:ribosome assembly protein 1